MTPFDAAWEVVKYDNMDFIEGVPYQRRIEHTADKLARHYSDGDPDPDRFDEEKRYNMRRMERDIERRKDMINDYSGKPLFPTNESLYHDIGPGFQGIYRGGRGTDGHILINLPQIHDSEKINYMLDEIRSTGPRPSRRPVSHYMRDLYRRRYGPGSDAFEQKLIDRLILNINHEVGHAVTNDEMYRFEEDTIGGDAAYDAAYDAGIDRESREHPLRRFKFASEALAHILEDPHNKNWRRSFSEHSDIFPYLTDEEKREYGRESSKS